MKLKVLEIENFKGIKDSVRIILDDIVILIGPNNCCKSTVLDAYEAYYSLGESLSTDFFNKDASSPISVTGIFADLSENDIEAIGKEWFIEGDPAYGDCAKFRIIWTEADAKGEKYSFSNKTNDWKKGGAGGWDSILKSRLPVPLRINAFETTEKLETILKDLIAKQVASAIKQDKSKILSIVEKIRELGKEIEKEIESDLSQINNSLLDSLKKSFPDVEVYFDTNVGKFEPEKSIRDGSNFIFTTNNMQAPLRNQGSGLQRSFLWAAIKAYSDKGLLKRKQTSIDAEQPKILLIDEPETNLHPGVIRSARDALYSLAQISGWQIICTTHSPIFIDLSKDHTTIIKVSNEIANIKYFQTDEVNFSDDERENLKMINHCNPHVNEFFFFEASLLVEGETEETTFKYLLEKHSLSTTFAVINCKGKANIPTFIKIISKFKTKGIAFHDADDKYIAGKKKNPMWTINKSILEECLASNKAVFPVVFIKNFEDYFFSEQITKNKPYNAYKHLTTNDFETNDRYSIIRDFIPNLQKGDFPTKYFDAPSFKTLLGEELSY
ncbi:ATP-dependent nuclease [Leptospira sp. SA-E8]|uniref:ATP-dependent nuclease n=1 Tax=Leptospira sp. SA-E8 TaxID=3422259 RepID=UPI003EC03AA8